MSEETQNETNDGSNTNEVNDNNESQQSTSTGSSERRSKDRRNDNRYQNNNVGSNDRNWQGSKPDIGVVLGLKTERLVHKKTFEVFRDKLTTYILSEFNNAKDILLVLKKMIDPMDIFKQNNTPKGLSEEDEKNSVQQAMQSQN
jgi:hypothetical protein